jgi:hypothetical protein
MGEREPKAQSSKEMLPMLPIFQRAMQSSAECRMRSAELENGENPPSQVGGYSEGFGRVVSRSFVGLFLAKLLMDKDVTDVKGFQRAMQFDAKGLPG